MNLNRAGRLLILTAASTLVLDGWVTGCRGRGPAMPVRRAQAMPSAGNAPPAPLVATDLTAYARGRSREVALMREALLRLNRAGRDSSSRRAVLRAAAPGLLEREGAAAAGLAVERYRDLVARMDSLLRVRFREVRSGDSAEVLRAIGSDGSADQWLLLDSLRVELAVLRSRFAAAAGEEGWIAP